MRPGWDMKRNTRKWYLAVVNGLDGRIGPAASLRQGYTNVAAAVVTNPIVVTETNTNVFTAGGPLHNSAGFVQSSVMFRLGQVVSFNYQLTNASGLFFRMVHQDEKAPPQFEVRQGDKPVAQGAFRFG